MAKKARKKRSARSKRTEVTWRSEDHTRSLGVKAERRVNRRIDALETRVRMLEKIEQHR